MFIVEVLIGFALARVGCNLEVGLLLEVSYRIHATTTKTTQAQTQHILIT